MSYRSGEDLKTTQLYFVDRLQMLYFDSKLSYPKVLIGNPGEKKYIQLTGYPIEAFGYDKKHKAFLCALCVFAVNLSVTISIRLN